MIRAEAESGLDSTVVDRLANLAGIEAALAFGPATDARATGHPGGAPAPVRDHWGNRLLDSRQAPPSIDPAWASRSALEEFGLIDDVGGIEATDGREFTVVGEVAVPDFLAFLEPLVVIPQQNDVARRVSVLVFIAATADLVGAVTAARVSMLAVDDFAAVSVTSSEGIAQLRAIVEGQPGTFGRELVLIVIGISVVLVASKSYGFTMLRRKGYRRGRALGASRSPIVTLVLLHMTMVSLIGATIGSTGPVIALHAFRVPVPGIEFLAATAISAVVVSVAAALLPAIVAARRDSIRELRVP